MKFAVSKWKYNKGITKEALVIEVNCYKRYKYLFIESIDYDDLKTEKGVLNQIINNIHNGKLYGRFRFPVRKPNQEEEKRALKLWKRLEPEILIEVL